MARFEITMFEPVSVDWKSVDRKFQQKTNFEKRETVYPTLTEAVSAFHAAAAARNIPPAYRDIRNHPDYPAFYNFSKNFLAVADKDETDMRRGAIALRRIP